MDLVIYYQVFFLRALIKDELFIGVYENNSNVAYDGCWMFGKRESKGIRGRFLKCGKGTFIIEYGNKAHFMQFFNQDGSLFLERFTISDINMNFMPNYTHSESLRHVVLNHRPASYDLGAFVIKTSIDTIYIKSMTVRTHLNKSNKFCNEIYNSQCWIAMLETDSERNTAKIHVYPGARIMLKEFAKNNEVLSGNLELSGTINEGKIKFSYDKKHNTDKSSVSDDVKNNWKGDNFNIDWLETEINSNAEGQIGGGR